MEKDSTVPDPNIARESAIRLGQEMNEHVGFFTLLTGMDKSGKPVWAYVDIEPSQYIAFEAASSRGDVDGVAKYIRKIWATGEGPPPPVKHIQQRLEKDYPNIQWGIKQELEPNFSEELRNSR